MDIRRDEDLDGLRLRPLAAADEPFLVRLFTSVRESDFVALPLPEPQKASLLQMQFTAQETAYRDRFPDAERWLVLHGTEPIGRLIVDTTAEEVRVVDLGLLAEWRGQGFGTALLRQVCAQAARRGLPVRLQVESHNPARRLYDRLGFRVVSTDDVYEQREFVE